jgi:hypothetical protein
MSSWIVSNATFTPQFNGIYNENGTYGGKPAYKKDDGDVNRWISFRIYQEK